ncbi:MAG: HAD family hydrolase [Aphanocapsa feldmannii 288cV]|nr:MAG: HAD family hydrolase [Aphanocapsa feldmannii 288cV]
MPLQALFWDVDGTLAETERDGHRPAFNAAFAEAGVPWHWDEATYRQLLRVAGGRERMRAWASQQPSPPQAFLADGTSFLEGLQRLKQQHYRQRLAAGLIQPRPGVLRLMGEAHERGLRQWIVTTSGRDAVEALLSTSLWQAAHWLEQWVCGEDVARKKPDPEAYRQALRRSGLANGSVVALEDSRNGWHAARRAHLRCLVTLSSSSWDDDRSGITPLWDGLGEPQQPARQLRGGAAALPMVTLSYLEGLPD